MYQNRKIFPDMNDIVSGIPTPQDLLNQVVQEIHSPFVTISKIQTPAEVLKQLPTPKILVKNIPTPLEIFSNPPKVRELLGKPPSFKELQAPLPPSLSSLVPTPGQWSKRMSVQMRKNPLAPLDMLIDVIDTFLPG